MTENINRTAIRSADIVEVDKRERITQFVKADEVVARQQIEQLKIQENVNAFMHGTRPECKDYAQMERLAIMMQQRDRIQEQLTRNAEEKRSKERKVCALVVGLTALFIGLVTLFVIHIR